VLALGLPSSFSDPGLLPPTQWRYRQLRNRGHRVFYVQSRRRCCEQGRCDNDILDGRSLVLTGEFRQTSHRRRPTHCRRTVGFQLHPFKSQRVRRQDFPYLLHGHGKLQLGDSLASKRVSGSHWKVTRSYDMVSFLLTRWVGSYHVDMNMDTVVRSIHDLFTFITGFKPRFRVHGGTDRENLALQNIQARLRMVISYLFAQLLPWVRGRDGGLLVLGSANVDERSI